MRNILLMLMCVCMFSMFANAKDWAWEEETDYSQILDKRTDPVYQLGIGFISESDFGLSNECSIIEIDGEWEFADVTERRDILAFRECAGSDVAAEECKRMQDLYGPQVDEADNKTYEAHSRALREDYEALRKYVAKTYPVLPPMPDPETDVFVEPIEEDEVTT